MNNFYEGMNTIMTKPKTNNNVSTSTSATLDKTVATRTPFVSTNLAGTNAAVRLDSTATDFHVKVRSFHLIKVSPLTYSFYRGNDVLSCSVSVLLAMPRDS